MTHPPREQITSTLREIQNTICSSLEQVDGAAKFQEDPWERTDRTGAPGGGGLTRVLADGAVFEKGGVNFSEVHGTFSAEFAGKLGLPETETPFFAAGVSLVIHPRSPRVPTTHANWRYIEAGQLAWFGGGSDLTPYVLYEQDAEHFHRVLKNVCDSHSTNYYPKFKKWCDEYFYLPHRQEHRGIGGIFFDHLGKGDNASLETIFPFVRDLGFAFVDQYAPIVERRKTEGFDDEDRLFQLRRRGRYVEFNLLYDRGTQFGLSTAGRTESILMSLPPSVRWDYCPALPSDPRKVALLDVVTHPREWV